MLRKVRGGFKIKKEHGGGYFSKKPMSRQKAVRQLRAIEASKRRRGK